MKLSFRIYVISMLATAALAVALLLLPARRHDFSLAHDLLPFMTSAALIGCAVVTWAAAVAVASIHRVTWPLVVCVAAVVIAAGGFALLAPAPR